MKRRPIGHACVFGLGWGDEGKGKVVDLLCPAFDFCVRYNGGANAGHTVWVGEEKFALHLLPTGSLHGHMTCVIGPGVVLDPLSLRGEIEGLAQRGIDISRRLLVSERAHLVFDYHKIEDCLSEQKAADQRIGTTSRGIGPCYADKMRRTTAVRLADLLHEPGVRERINGIVSARKAMFMALYGTDGGLDGGKIDTQAQMAAELLGNLAADTSMRLEEAAESGRRILFEAANGVLLDVDHGTYPFVTSSSTGPNGIAAGAGVPGSLPSCLIGVAKSYSTRVGAGPFVTELKDAFGDRIREQGKEFGTTTGRPRRCGWFDAVACRYAARLNGMTELALLHLDTLSGMDQLGICVAYRLDGEDTDTFPASATQLDRAEPVLEYLPGWSEDLRRVRDYAELPLNARRFVERLEELLGVQASVIGVGPQRSQSIVRGRIRELLEGRRSSEAMRVSS